MSLSMFVIPLLLLTTAVQRGVSFNVGYVTMPLFEMLVKDLPQDESESADDYTGGALVTAFYAKVRTLDVWRASTLGLDIILRDKATTIITDAKVQFERGALVTENLVGDNCTRHCYNVSVATILSATGWTEDRLDGKVQPIVRMTDIHDALVKAIEERFCCNMTEIAILLGLDPVTGVQQTAVYINVWERFVPHVNEQTIQCKADELQVTTSELAELLRTDLATLRSYDLNQMDLHFFPAYEDLLRRKNLFETLSILTGGLFVNWQSSTMAHFANSVSQFSPRDLQILYRWEAPQLFAIENIPMSIFQSGCTTVSLTDSLFVLSRTLFGHSTNLPNCDVAFLLSRSFDEVSTKYTISSLSTQNVLEIFRTSSGKPSWFEIYQLLQLNVDEGIWVESPTLSQVALFRGIALNSLTAQSSIPIAISNIKTFNTTSTLNTIMSTNYNSFLSTLLNTYGYTSSGLALAAGITVSQLNSLTIQGAHNLVIDSIQARYRINDVASLLGINTHVLINLPSFEWQRVVTASIQNAFAQSADAYSVLLSAGGVQIATIAGGFSAIQVSDSVTYHADRITPTELATCLNRQLSDIYAMSFAQYHQFHTNNIVALLQNKLRYETQTMDVLLTSIAQDFDDVKSRTVAEVISLLTGMTIENLQCLYGWNTTFVNTDLALTFQNANETRLCNDFLGRTMFDIVRIISQTPNKVCFLCTTGPCGQNAMCRDVPDSYVCTCHAGYTGNPGLVPGVGCIDIPECLIPSHNCDANARCTETPGSFDCTCNEGFIGNGRTCLDLNECTINPGRCGLNGVCRNTIGSFVCDCVTGYRWNGTTCVDINECNENLDSCHFAAICTNTIGSYTCHCPTGLSGDGRNCEDVLECSFAAGAFPCHARANCIETFGSYLCRCMDGYTGNGLLCTDIDECDSGTDDCHVNATCFNTVPSFLCVCNQGFLGNGRQCNDINECLENLDNCHQNADCFNTIGSFYCDCKDGFNGNGTYCYVAEVSFTRASAAITEGGDIAISFSLNGRIDTIAVVNVQVTGTATELVDYNSFTKAFFYNPGDPSTKTFNISTIDDQRLEGLETIILTLSPIHSHVTPGNIPSMTITIVDNDAIGVAFSQETYTVAENNGFANVIVQIQSGIVERDFIVSVVTSPGTALAGADFTTHTQQLTFSPGNADPQLVRIPLVDNNRVEEEEQFSVLLSTTDSDVNIINSPATVIIQDNDVATVKFQSSTYQVNEGAGQITVRLDVTGIRDVAVIARLNTANIGATAESDYTSITNKDITILPSVTVLSETITISEDVILENDETFSVTVASRSSPHLITAAPSVTTVTIEDNDVVSVRFSQSSYFTEEELTQVNVRVIVAGQLQRPVQLSLSTRDQSATQGNDYQQNTVSLTFNPGDPQERNVPIQILEDTLIENTETLSVELTTTDTDIVFSNGNTASITITDDDVASVYIPNNAYSYNEHDGTTNIPVILQGNLAIPVTVRWSTQHDTATWPSDFTVITNRDIIFRPGEPAVQQLQVNILDDDVVESTEQFSVVLNSQDAKVTIGTHGTATVSIIDNDQLRVNFSSSRYEADEDSGFALVGLVLHDVLETTTSVRLTPSNGTATEPHDFPLVTYTVVLDPGQPRTVYYRVNITNDMLEEYSEHFLLTLWRINTKVVIVDPSVANITIGESDDIFFCDPNANQYPCHIKADCVDVPSSFQCTCVSGYEGDGKSCTNINECLTIVCPFNATCEDTQGSYRCICKDGFRGDGVNCVDINECAEDTDECHEQATCQNTLGSYQCMCNQGWFGNGTFCSDINECNQVNDCHTNSDCINNVGSYDCRCKPGFRGDGKTTCDDINECNEVTHNCHRQATCSNNVGSFACQCNVGWSGNGTHCWDINECLQSLDNDCDDVNGLCWNNDGSFTCQCKQGFSGDGKTCIDINECQEDIDNCPDNSNCNNTIGGFECICSPGFIHNGSICADINECSSNQHNCHANANCWNQPGTFQCACKNGYTGNGIACSNVNECANNPDPCDPNANCTDTDGSFNCVCRTGFSGNGLVCEDIIDCILLPQQYPCDIRASCQDVPGSFICTCPSGLTLNADQRNCDDINECASPLTYTCHQNASCVNTAGSYRCVCRDGFVGDGVNNCIDTTCTTQNPCSADANCSVNVISNTFNCICHHGFSGDGFTCNDINECQIPGSCGANTNCVNVPRGSHTCSCLSGYTGDPYVGCIDVNECINNPCHLNATCDNQQGTFGCNCNTGFSGNGVTTCNDVVECNDPTTCDANARCENTIGSHYCICNFGYSGNGKFCQDINECLDPSRCPANSACNNSPGTFTCTCNIGFTPVGGRCDDINECNGDPCTEDGAVCTNTVGSYTCTCPEDLYNNGNLCYVFCPFKLDLAFIVDTSDSINANDFDQVKQFMTETIGRMEIGPTGNHIAALSFGNTAEIFMRFDTVTGANLTRRNLINRFANFPKNGGLTRIDLALLLAETDVFTAANGMRTDSDIRKIAVVLTDGAQTMGPGVPAEPLAHIARRLQSQDITVMAIAVGQQVPRDQLLNLTNSIEENILEVDTFANLLNIINQFVNISCTGVNECEVYDDVCHDNANCKDSLGAYSCLCNEGYSGDGFDCADVNECNGRNDCDRNAVCSNTEGSFDCTCNSGYSGNGRQCPDVDECAGINNCDGDATCSNNDGSYDCTCNSGYSGDGRLCDDVNECEGVNDCHANAMCSNTEGSYDCTCDAGYSGDGRQCEATDCAVPCIAEAVCSRSGSGFQCVCRSGYTGDGTTCSDINECNGAHGCHAQATCQNTAGSHECLCNGGWTGDGRSCSDINECASSQDNDCDGVNGSCTNNDGGFTCRCKPGYTGDGKTCNDINECADSQSCHTNADCDNTDGGHTCTCMAGYSGDGQSCTDTACGGSCHANAQCELDGLTYRCRCQTGYAGNGTSCTDIDECNGNNDCDSNAQCANTDGSYTCTCRSGFVGTGRLCTNINECTAGTHNCHEDATCTDNVGSFSCQCKAGYTGNGVTCSDINECNGNNDCDSNAQCANTDGSYTCTCRSGFVGTGRLCTNINECTAGTHNCHENATCTDNAGSFSCQCKAGYTGNGVTCSKISGCENCPDNSLCVNNQGTNECQCDSGYSKNDAANTCDDTNECTSSVSVCGADQACRNYPGTYECFCTSPGKFLINGTCEDVSSVTLTITILNSIFEAALASNTSAEFYNFKTRLEDRLNDYFRSLYPSDFLDSEVLNLSEGSVVAQILLVFKPDQVPDANSLNNKFVNSLGRNNANERVLDTYVISTSTGQSSRISDYNECNNPVLGEHSTADCPAHSYCENTYGSWTCKCLIGFEKHSAKHDFCVSEDDDWWIVYAVIFGAIGFVVLILIFLFCCLEFKRNEDLYTLHGENRPRDKRIDEEVAPGFPGTVPRTSSTGSQLLLGTDKGNGRESLAMYEVNPIYDSANG